MKMKLFLASVLCASFLAADDYVVSPDSLPPAAKSFISQHFKGSTIGLVKRDMNSFDVTLTDGTEIDFNINGQWTDVDGRFKPVPTSFLPNGVASKVSAANGGAAIMEVERNYGGFKFKLNNRMKVYTDLNGNILGQKFDD